MDIGCRWLRSDLLPATRFTVMAFYYELGSPWQPVQIMKNPGTYRSYDYGDCRCTAGLAHHESCPRRDNQTGGRKAPEIRVRRGLRRQGHHGHQHQAQDEKKRPDVGLGPVKQSNRNPNNRYDIKNLVVGPQIDGRDESCGDDEVEGFHRREDGPSMP